MDALQDWIVTTSLNQFVMGMAWTWPTLETLHFLALCLLLGALLVMDLRLIGLEKAIPLKAVHSLMPVAIGAFAVNLITGLGFLVGDPRLYTSNWAFWTKMVLILLAGLNFLLYYKKVEPQLFKLGPNDATPGLAKAVGAASLLFWFGVLTFGRLLPYLGPGGG